ncbi:2-oxoglutarate dehydrogenase, mitochondrial [Drosophila ficusphila]|uniref:2-oxoglutarate dehydrogenase, mitochondrial n=1 Tax=Drosophila ficusphila TaxID=30025 RepID=UPI0007E7C77A|nr:2-oxoglutarate dehydrogenase, mitochondrial [Drosophila ficusphila]
MNQCRLRGLVQMRRELALGLLGSKHHVLAQFALRGIQTTSPLGGTQDMDSFASGCSAAYIEGLYNKWKNNPKSVDQSWDDLFNGNERPVSKGIPIQSSHSRKYRRPPVERTAVKARSGERTASGGASPAPAPPPSDWKNIDDHHAIQAIIRAYQSRGHLAADLDPLGIVGPQKGASVDGTERQATKEVLRQHYSYIFGDLNATFKLPSSTMIGGDEEFLPLREILDRLERIYCGHIGVEYMQITSLTKTTWIRDRFEKPGGLDLSKDEKKLILERLTRSTGFENFLAKKFSSEKRFGLEGCDIMIPTMKEVVDRSTNTGVESIFIGMAHRGRLNVLANVCRKPISDILSQFHGLQATDSGSGDVKYHLGVFQERLNRQTNRMVRITVVANPSHLEHVNPVLLGKARAEMFQRGDVCGKRVLPIIIHGDASFCGQGVVFESMHLSDLPNYTTYGTIHIVSNNQVGFTTDPRFSRSSRYCTDVAKVVAAPILHVNADDPEACIQCARIAADYRATFKKDVVIDLVGYRRNGHNEADEPMFTQPLMYQRIRKLKPCLQLYAEKLIKEGVVTDSEFKAMVANYDKICEEAWKESKEVKSIKYSSWIDSPWPGFFEGRDRLELCPTGISTDTLKTIGEIFSSPPPPEHKFEMHKGIHRILALRKQMVQDKVADWSLGEAFAFGSLLKEGIHVRLSGQDVERGTFSHRHHVLHHQTADKVVYIALDHLYPDQAPYSVSNSSLSECAVLGFEHGYSMASPHALVIWEGQFGDFCNTAQCIIDTFIASGEAKWVRQSGVVLLLPHSMEGMGPEHSSGRMERFLQMSDDDPDVYPDTCDADFVARQLMNVNWIVTNFSTPANLFHGLRRQVKMGFRKPLINFSPKSLLRHPLARSPFKDFNECSCFQRIIPDKGPAGKQPECVKKLVFCSGKVYYDLVKERDDHEQVETVALVRVEQLCPFPYDLITEQLKLYPKAELLWAQEEHKNMGGWFYVQPRFDTALLKNENETRCVSYHGRPPSSSPATGNKVQHYSEYAAIIKSIFGELTPENKKRLEAKVKEQQEKAKAESQSSPPKDGAAPPATGASAGKKKQHQSTSSGMGGAAPSAKNAPSSKKRQQGNDEASPSIDGASPTARSASSSKKRQQDKTEPYSTSSSPSMVGASPPAKSESLRKQRSDSAPSPEASAAQKAPMSVKPSLNPRKPRPGSAPAPPSSKASPARGPSNTAPSKPRFVKMEPEQTPSSGSKAQKSPAEKDPKPTKPTP